MPCGWPKTSHFNDQGHRTPAVLIRGTLIHQPGTRTLMADKSFPLCQSKACLDIFSFNTSNCSNKEKTIFKCCASAFFVKFYISIQKQHSGNQK